ncbi:MAG: YfbK domain-containing protein [Planctomycetota bacterium]|jgi:Ca-activated chloride channel family protein
MSKDIDDPRMTAYALGEMDQAQRMAFEAELAEDPDARRQVEQIRRLAAELTDQLAAEPAPELTDRQRRAVTAQAAPGAAKPKAARPPRRSLVLRLWVPMAAAAGIVIAFCVFLAQQTDDGLVETGRFPALAVHPAAEKDTGLSQRRDVGNKQLTADAEGGRSARRVTKPGDVRVAHTVVPDAGQPGPAGPSARPSEMDSLNTKADIRFAGGHPAPRRGYRYGGGDDRPVTGPGGVSRAALAMRESDVRRRLDEAKRRLGADHDRVKELQKVAEGLGELRRSDGRFNTEAYDHIVENAFLDVRDNPLSTFSIDVDTASYSNVRRFLKGGQLPPAGAVRIEELINYFTYDYEPPRDGRPFAVHVNVTGCPWAPKHRLVRVALKGKVVEQDKRPPTNLVFLLDVSGSMRSARKLPLVKQAMKMLVERLSENDTVAIAVYAGSSGLVLDATSADQTETILGALDRLSAGGSTNGGQGIKLAYKVAAEHFIKGGVNRVILCTDGDFNVGTTNRSELIKLIQDKAKTGVFLSVLGFGRGNVKDAAMESLADKGNGNYAYIDTIAEAEKVLVEQMAGTLVTIAKDVKIQIEFNPAQVAEYRLIGYENRILAKEDFNDDTKDAGEIGAGHTVTALYEIVPAAARPGAQRPARVDPLKYQSRPGLTEAAATEEMLTVKLRHKAPDGDKSKLIERAVVDDGGKFNDAPGDLKFAAAVASFGMILRDSKHVGSYSLDAVAELAAASRGADPAGRRAEFVELVKAARKLKGGT